MMRSTYFINGHAREVFDKRPLQDVISWTALIGGYAENGQAENALKYFKKMQLHCVPPNAVTFICFMKACSSGRYMRKGQQIQIMMQSHCLLRTDLNVGNALIDMYVKCGTLRMAQEVFHSLPIRDVISWTTLLEGYVELGLSGHALKFVEEMRIEGIFPNNVTFICSLKACSKTGARTEGLEVHSEIEKRGLLDKDKVIGNILVDMYIKCGLLVSAQHVFDRLSIKTDASWTAIISGYTAQGFGQKAVEYFRKMQLEAVSPDAVCLICSLKACASIGAKDVGREIHVEIERRGLLDTNIAAGNTLVDMYVKFHLLTKAEEVFESLSGRNIVTWNVLISGYVECDQSDRALKCLEQMHLEGINPDAITFVCCLKACACVGDINKGEEIRGIVDRQGLPQSNIDIGNALIFMYVKCGSLAKAEEAFDLLTVRNEASWNTLISGYVENGKFKKALDCLQRMEDAGSLPDSVTFILSLKICGVMGEIDKGKGIHLFIEKQGMHTYSNSVSNSLISMYARSGLLTKAHEIFDRLELQDVISWNTLISAYTELGLYEEAIKIFSKMQLAGNIPDFFTYISVLKACGKTGAIDKGHELHDAIEKIDIQEGMVVVGSTLVEMYANMGFLRKAQRVFDKLCIRGVVSWTILLSGYAQLGEFKGVFELFRNMLDEDLWHLSVSDEVGSFSCFWVSWHSDNTDSEWLREGM